MTDTAKKEEPNREVENAAGLESDEVFEKNIDEKLQDIEKKLAKINKESRVSTDDQLFFGLVLSFLLFFLAVPLPDVTSFFQTTFGLSGTDASTLALGLKNSTVFFLLLSLAFRYYAALKFHKGSRLWSILFLLTAFELFLWNLFLSLRSQISGLIGNPPESLYVASLLSYAMSFLSYSLMAKYVESKGLEFYADKQLIQSKYARPFVSALFMAFSGSAFIAGMLIEVIYFRMKILLSVEVQNVIFFLSFIFCLVMYVDVLRKTKVL